MPARDERRESHLRALASELDPGVDCSSTLPRSAGNTSASMATTSGHPNRSSGGFGRCEIRAPPFSMPFSVRFRTDSAMTPIRTVSASSASCVPPGALSLLKACGSICENAMAGSLLECCALQIHLHKLQMLESLKHIAMPEIPLDALERH